MNMKIPAKIKSVVTLKNAKTAANIGLTLATLFGILKPAKATAIRDKVLGGIGLVEAGKELL